jgi:hypothetical protein
MVDVNLKAPLVSDGSVAAESMLARGDGTS